MPKAVIFGAGNVGRGLVGQLLVEAGYAVTFVDMDDRIIAAINARDRYPHFTISNLGRAEKIIGPVHALHGSHKDQVVEAITAADLVATSVGAHALPFLADNIAAGIRQRIARNLNPLNILLCENLHQAAKRMKEWLLACLPDLPENIFDSQVGLVETSIGRMIPAPSETIRQIHPAAIQVEPYKFLPYDIHAVKGSFPAVPGLVGDWDIPFAYYGDRKLYIHNMGHAMCAYLSRCCGLTFIWEGIMSPEIRYFVRSAMLESALALALRYNQPLQPLIHYVDDLLYRFGNKLLGDTVERVGRDPKRKLAAGDRLVGAYQMCCENKSDHGHLSLGLAAGLHDLAECEKMSDADLLSYIEEQGILKDVARSDLAEGESKRLLLQQMAALQKQGFDFTVQTGLINERYHISKIV